ncbi:MAG: TolC family protein [Runella zeae]
MKSQIRPFYSTALAAIFLATFLTSCGLFQSAVEAAWPLLGTYKMNNIQLELRYTANGAYNLNFQNNRFVDLYGKNFPNSFMALTLSLPIYQGGKRKTNINTAEWQIKRVDLDIQRLKMNINAEYANALSAYKANLIELLAQKDNMDLAKEVYDIIQLQYKSGIKTYLEVITSEADLRLARINYYSSLYQVLASKVDVQKALGQINF